MIKQCLDVQQMQHLQELGLKLKPSLVHYYKINNIDSGKWYLSVTTGDISEDNPTYQYIPAYTLQDVLDALPKEIEKDDKNYQLEIYRNPQIYFVSYYWLDNLLISLNSENLIDAAYGLLCWCIENKFVETNKNE